MKTVDRQSMHVTLDLQASTFCEKKTGQTPCRDNVQRLPQCLWQLKWLNPQ